MSLAINVTTSSGLVLAADSRQSYRNQLGASRIGSDNASKLFQLSKRVGCVVTGIAFLPGGDGNIRNISAFIEEFKRKEECDKMGVLEIAEKIHKFFNEKYDWKKNLENIKAVIIQDLDKKDFKLVSDFIEEKGVLKFKYKDKTEQERQGVVGVDRIDIMVAGFNHDGSHQVFICSAPGDVSKKRDSKEKEKYGASWIGQQDVLSRVVLGFENRFFNLPFVQKAVQEMGEGEIVKQLRGLQYQISWGTMTLQDAIDFCVLAIKTTEAIQRFSDGVVLAPGDIPGVGGAVDVAVITRDKGFVWVKKKNLQIDDEIIDLDKFENLK